MPKFAPVYMTVYDGPDPVLVDLEIDTNTAVVGDLSEGSLIGTLSGNMAGSTLALDDPSGHFALDEEEGVYSVVVTASVPEVGEFPITITETNDEAENSPHDTEITISVTAE